MKTNLLTWIVAIFLATATFAQAATNDLSRALQKGLFEEEANHNLEAAAQEYQSVAAQFDKDRKLAATAIFRLGEVYRKQGKTNEASAQYERILREFSDQTELVKLSQKFVGTTPGKSDSDQGRAIEQLLASSRSEYQSKAAILSNLKKLSRKQLRESLPIIDSDSYLTELLKKLSDAEQKLAVAKKEFASEHPEVKKAQTIVDVITLQMDQRIDATLTALEMQVTNSKAKVEDLENNLAKARKEQSTQFQAFGIVEQPRSVLSAEQQEIARIKAMIKDSPDLINAQRGPDGGPLHSAAQNGQLMVAEFLLANGAGIDRKSGQNQTPLYLAAQNGHRAMVELLISKGADVDLRDNSGQTALHRASSQGFRAVAETLLENKADANAKDDGGNTPLHLAAARGHRAVGELLLANGAKIDAKDENGLTPLILAVESKNLEMAKFLIANKADVNARAGEKNYRGFAPLHFAIRAGNSSLVELLLKSGADVEAKVSDNPRSSDVIPGSTPLQMAVIRGQTEIAKLLLEHQANPNSTTDAGATPLHSAVGKEHRETAELLLSHGATVDSQDKNGSTPLFSAVLSGQKKMAELLLTHKADPNIQNNVGKTLLGSLKPSNRFHVGGEIVTAQELIELLKKYGANENAERLTRISSTRAGKEHRVFPKGNQPLNRYTLIELILATGYSFPDFANVKIDRLEEGGRSSRIIPVNVEEMLKAGDCAKNVWLEWGDVVEIPELDHRINESWHGYPKEYAETMQKCLERTVSISVKGQTTNVTLKGVGIQTGGMTNSWRVNWPEFSLGDVAKSHLRASSDRSRIQVKRSDPLTQQSHEIVVNLEKQDPDLWLLDGDEIEIPERDPNVSPTVSNQPQGGLRSNPSRTLREFPAALPPLAPRLPPQTPRSVP